MSAQPESRHKNTMLSSANVPAVVMLTANNIQPVLSCRGKDIILFLGREQAGKSTTINSLFGCHFKWVKTPLGKQLEPYGEPEPVAPMGSHKTHGQRCTVFPAAYPATEDLELYYVDTQGFFGTEPSKEEIVAASILLDAVVQEARSVRVVYLEESYIFMRGAAGMADMGRVLNEVIQIPSSNVYCLFNKFQWGNFYEPEEMMGWMPQEKVAQAKEKLMEGCRTIQEAARKAIEALENKTKKLQEGLAGDVTDEQVLECLSGLFPDVQNLDELRHNINYAEIVGSNFEAGHYGYIDPLIPESADVVRSEIFAMAPIEKSAISFDSSTNHRVLFNREFENTLARQINPLLKEVLFGLKYPPSVITQIQDKGKQKLAELSEDRLKVQHEENLPELSAKYKEVHLAETADAEKILTALQKEKMEAEESIRRLMESEPMLVRKVPFHCKPSKFPGFWANCDVKYHEDVPFVRVVENLDEHTRREKMKHPSSGEISEKHRSNNCTVINVRDTNKPQSEFEATYTSARKNQKVIQGAANIIGTAAGSIALAAVLGVAALPAGFALGKLYGKVNSKFSFDCRGELQFYARPQDKEQESLQSYEKVLEAVKSQIQGSEENLEKLNKANLATLEEQISLLMSNVQCDLSRYPELVAFSDLKNQLWRAHLPPPLESIPQLVTRLHQIGELLYPPHSEYHSEALATFEQIHASIIAATAPASSGSSSSSSSSSSSADVSEEESAEAAASAPPAVPDGLTMKQILNEFDVLGTSK